MLSDAKRKYNICKGCEFSKRWCGYVTCGTLSLRALQFGEVVRHEGKDIKLCGCIMKVKTITLPDAACPAGKW